MAVETNKTVVNISFDIQGASNSVQPRTGDEFDTHTQSVNRGVYTPSVLSKWKVSDKASKMSND